MTQDKPLAPDELDTTPKAIFSELDRILLAEMHKQEQNGMDSESDFRCPIQKQK